MISQLIQHQNLKFLVSSPHNYLGIMWGRDKFWCCMIWEIVETKNMRETFLLWHPLQSVGFCIPSFWSREHFITLCTTSINILSWECTIFCSLQTLCVLPLRLNSIILLQSCMLFWSYYSFTCASQAITSRAIASCE